MAGKDGFNLKLVFVIIAAALGSGFQHGFHTGVVNIPQDVLQQWVNESYENMTGKYLVNSTEHSTGTSIDTMWSVTTSIMNLGGTVGGLLTAVFAKYFGPKGGLLINNLFFAIATILFGISKPLPSLVSMIIGRFVIGVNCGLNAGLCPMYLSEISPVSLRGTISSVYQLVITISILISQLVGFGWALGTAEKWQYLFLLPIIFALYQVITLLFCPESPRYLVSVKQNIPKAEQALKFLRSSDDVGEDLELIKSEDEHAKALPKITIKDMFTIKYLRTPLIIALALMVAQQFSGINAVIFYSTNTFVKAGIEQENAKFGTIAIGVVNVLMTVVSVYVVEIAGRKTLLLIGFGGMAIVTLLLSGILYEAVEKEITACAYGGIGLVIIYIILFAAGAGSIPWFLVTEIFNQSARPTAASMAVPTNWISNFIVTLAFPNVEALIKSWVFIIFAILNALFFLFIWKLVPETKNKTVDEIIKQWQ